MRITCVVDNCVAQGSALWGEHGLAFLIETEETALLWDTGQSGDVLRHNLQALGLEGADVRVIALSHAHYDHTGGLGVALACFPRAKGFAHPAILEPRYALREGKCQAIGLAEEARRWLSSVEVSLVEEPVALTEGVWTTGEIRKRPFPEGRSTHHMAMREGHLVPDDYRDDLSLVLQVPGGIALLCGCCHAGLRNTLATVQSQYREPIVAILGGTHLGGASDGEILSLVETLRALGSPRLYLNHCTGDRALHMLASHLGEAVQHCPAGTVITF